MIEITLNQIEQLRPCEGGWEKILAAQGGEHADYNKLFTLVSAFESNHPNDVLWALRCLPEYNDLWRKYACWCALLHIEKIKPYCSKSEYNCILEYLNNPTAEARAAEAAAETAAFRTSAGTAEAATAWAAAWAAGEAGEVGEAAAWAAEVGAGGTTLIFTKLRQIIDAGEWVEDK